MDSWYTSAAAAEVPTHVIGDEQFTVSNAIQPLWDLGYPTQSAYAHAQH